MPPLAEFDFAAQLGVRVRSRADCPMRFSISALLILLCATSASAQQSAVAVDVRSNGGPVREAEVVVNGATFRTDGQGRVVIDVPSGRVDITIVKQGYIPLSTSVEVSPNQRQPVIIDLVREVTVEEHVTVSATRTDRGIEDQPMRVEVVDREEIDEKAMMTPGDVVMLLNETGGMRVQTTSPSLARLAEARPLKAERGRSASIDLSHTSGPLSTTLTLFHSRVENPVDVSRTDRYVIRNLTDPTTNWALMRRGNRRVSGVLAWSGITPAPSASRRIRTDSRASLTSCSAFWSVGALVACCCFSTARI